MNKQEIKQTAITNAMNNPQGCLPSANCSAEAGAEAQPNSLISSVVPPKEAVLPLTPKEDAIEVMMCAALLQHLDSTQVAAVLGTYLKYRDDPNTCEILQYRQALALHCERACLPNDKVSDPAAESQKP